MPRNQQEGDVNKAKFFQEIEALEKRFSGLLDALTDSCSEKTLVAIGEAGKEYLKNSLSPEQKQRIADLNKARETLAALGVSTSSVDTAMKRVDNSLERAWETYRSVLRPNTNGKRGNGHDLTGKVVRIPVDGHSVRFASVKADEWYVFTVDPGTGKTAQALSRADLDPQDGVSYDVTSPTKARKLVRAVILGHRGSKTPKGAAMSAFKHNFADCGTDGVGKHGDYEYGDLAVLLEMSAKQWLAHVRKNDAIPEEQPVKAKAE